ncbi:sigma-54-dependent Fis family transcriptional regulator [Vibrio rhodolitus]|uniref:sigma-54-dependent Fis family transcriptional regulator n=1 Tax=Vibrio rhodolitus TaxID=2231649 RepID=UPI000E0A08C0|nr:sigma-54-dependent Fis family transcriptional regulator [Vibrio rhodolitus]
MELQALKAHDWLMSSWNRSSAAGLNEKKKPHDTQIPRSSLQERKFQAKALISAVELCALPLFNQMMARTDSRLILSDVDGVLVGSWGQERFRDKLTAIALNTGACWLERLKGTNAIGTALIEKKPVSVVGDQHFIRSHRFISCTASPIYGPRGDIIGVLDVTSEQQKHDEATKLVVYNMAQLVENHLLSQVPNASLRVSMAIKESVLQSSWEGVLVADGDGNIVAHNRVATQLLDVQQLLGSNVDELLQQASQHQAIITYSQRLDSKKSPSAVKNAAHCLHAGDAQIESAWQQATKILGNDISLLISGETGAGKGEFVKALHKYSDRAKQPLVNVNCGALPSNLIESELFGHVAGAFTGASSKGYLGKIRQADKGILFLDEIGEMPLEAQCRLLGVLQDKEVTPLGSTQQHKVDIQVIAATHQNLLDLVEQGKFRQDLYYRLNGLEISLPALRQREDKPALIESIYRKYAQPEQTLDAKLLELLMNYTWPGNVRELDNVLKVAALISQGERFTQLEHIPSHLRNSMVAQPAIGDESQRGLKQTLEEQLLATYQAQNQNVSRTSKLLGISRNTVYRKLRQLGIIQ